jgi:riboflavin synthase
MFTGLIESVGTVEEVSGAEAGRQVIVATHLAAELPPGASVAINGVCLTVVASDHGTIRADLSPETVRVTTLGGLKVGSLVNLERPIRANSRIEGHFVQGHVDATGIIEQFRQDGDSYWLTVRYPPMIGPYLVRKGSIAIDGISLTIAGLGELQFDVQVIPFTFQHTNLQIARAMDAVNLECDILGKYVARAVEFQREERPL